MEILTKKNLESIVKGNFTADRMGALSFCVAYQSRIYLRRTVPSSKTLSTMINTIIAMVTWYLAAHFPHIL